MKTALGRKLPHAGEVSSNPRPHQKTMHLDLSRLVGLSLLLRQDTSQKAPHRGAFAFAVAQTGWRTSLDVVAHQFRQWSRDRDAALSGMHAGAFGRRERQTRLTPIGENIGTICV
ncbi:hypothetical protein [Prosthecobacter sp.]|uniref:hypothetical protein n=1 Tax=Prosthecobacter sp. TaxID=1965333 RepID=UPI003784F9A6